MIRISSSSAAYEREPLKAPFGFKGGYLSELWQTVVCLESDRGLQGVGLGTQSTLWSDVEVFGSTTEAEGNTWMYQIMTHALKLAEDIPFETPPDLLEQLIEPAWAYGKTLTGRADLRMTFVLNALVALDNAAWQLYAADQKLTDFDELVPATLKAGVQARQSKLAAVPLMSYGVSVDDIVQAVEQGYFFMKIKIGSNPDGDGDKEKMLAWDKQRLSDIHEVLKDRDTPHTDSGHLLYYLDANGGYDSTSRLMQFLDHAESIGALERILILEEPFPEDFSEDLSDVPVRLAADESAHSDRDALERIQMGYEAIALKPIAKTMSMSLAIAKLAHDHHVPCFCADLTVNPILVDWNKNVASRLPPLPGMNVGVLESNGHQNYKNWEKMKQHHPRCGALWTQVENGLYHLDEDFFGCSGSIFDSSSHYASLLRNTPSV